jgi:hypothetical protein
VESAIVRHTFLLIRTISKHIMVLVFLGGGKLKLRAKSVIFRFTVQKNVRPRRAVARFPGHESRGLRHAAPLGDGMLAARMGPSHQKFERRASSDALLALSHRRGQYVVRSMARQEQLRIAACNIYAPRSRNEERLN